MELYQGFPVRGGSGGYKVLVNGQLLDPGYHLRNHSPDGFAWGYGGSGPSQLALALMLDATKDLERTSSMYQDFKFDKIAGLSKDEPWEMTDTEIWNWVREQEERRRERSAVMRSSNESS